MTVNRNQDPNPQQTLDLQPLIQKVVHCQTPHKMHAEDNHRSMSLCGEVSALCTAQSTFLAHCCGAGRMHAHAARGTRCARLARRAVAGGPERAETDVRVSLSLSSPRRRGRAGQGSQGGLGHVPVKPAQFECESRSVTALAALRLAPAHRDCQWQPGPARRRSSTPS